MKCGISYAEGKKHNDRIINMAAEVGLDYRYDIMMVIFAVAVMIGVAMCHFIFKKGMYIRS